MQAQLRSFYIDALGLEPVEGEPGMVCFQTQRMQVRILITLDAQPSPMRRRLVLQIPSLERMRERLEEFEIDYQWYEGLSFTDQRIFVHDPADNRVELKQLWPM